MQADAEGRQGLALAVLKDQALAVIQLDNGLALICRDGLADRVYAGDLFGEMWAFDLSGSNTSNWDVAYKQGSTPKPLFTSPANQQITSVPVIVRNKDVPTSSSNDPNTLVYRDGCGFTFDGVF